MTSEVQLGLTWNEEEKSFRVVGFPARYALTLSPGDSIILKLENVTVATGEGLTLLSIRENKRGRINKPRNVTLGLVKNAPKGPRNFHPVRSMVDADAGENVTLTWEGPDNLSYWIRDPKGNEVLAQSAAQGPLVTQQTYTWSPPSAPKRGTTYTHPCRRRDQFHAAGIRPPHHGPELGGEAGEQDVARQPYRQRRPRMPALGGRPGGGELRSPARPAGRPTQQH
jgi:hypothetical protein